MLRRRGLHQRQVARQLGIHESTLSNYLRGEVRMPAEITARFQQAVEDAARAQSARLMGEKPAEAVA